MYVILIHYTKPIEEIDKHKPSHSQYLDSFYASGTMIVSGRRLDQKGGVLIANMASRAEVEALIAGDPYGVNGVAEYEVIDFHPSKYSQDFGTFLRIPPTTTELRPDTPLPGDVDTTAR
ncbi:MAG: YciI family protein [Acidobacteriaceae bacterium]